ncbi:hypothetical protein T484DRAFT_2179128, partial [Baffinella frigidus]
SLSLSLSLSLSPSLSLSLSIARALSLSPSRSFPPSFNYNTWGPTQHPNPPHPPLSAPTPSPTLMYTWSAPWANRECQYYSKWTLDMPDVYTLGDSSAEAGPS